MSGYHDGVYHDARRNYRDCPRSFHIPPESEYRRPTFALVIFAVVIACAFVGSLAHSAVLSNGSIPTGSAANTAASLPTGAE